MGVRIAFFDCDGTLTKVKSSWEFLHRRLNIWDNRADEYQRLFREGRISYLEFCRRDALLWKGLRLSDVMEILDEIPYQEGARETIAALHSMGVSTVILSTGLSLLVDKVGEDLGFSVGLSNELLSEGGRLTGDIRINVEYDGKGVLVEAILGQMGAEKNESCAVGDGYGDKGMFGAVGLSIGFHPHPSLAPLLDHSVCEGSLLPVVDIIRGHGAGAGP
jgi:phosphoserine phosphatase